MPSTTSNGVPGVSETSRYAPGKRYTSKGTRVHRQNRVIPTLQYFGISLDRITYSFRPHHRPLEEDATVALFVMLKTIRGYGLEALAASSLIYQLPNEYRYLNAAEAPRMS